MGENIKKRINIWSFSPDMELDDCILACPNQLIFNTSAAMDHILHRK